LTKSSFAPLALVTEAGKSRFLWWFLQFGMSYFDFAFGKFMSNANESSKMILSFPSQFDHVPWNSYFFFFPFLLYNVCMHACTMCLCSCQEQKLKAPCKAGKRRSQSFSLYACTTLKQSYAWKEIGDKWCPSGVSTETIAL